MMNMPNNINSSPGNPNTFSQIFFTRLIWLFPAAFFIHFLEEMRGFSYWVNKTLGGSATMKGFLISNAIFMIILLTLCIMATRIQKTWATFLLFLWVGAQQYGNFVFHFYSLLAFGVYSPGIVSAVFIYNPLYLLLGYFAIRDRHLTLRAFLLSTVIGIPAMFLFALINIYRFGTIPWDKWL